MNWSYQIVLAAFAVLVLAVPAAADLSVWFAPGALKVMRDAKPAKSSGQWDLAAARNEVENCQLVLLSDKELKDVKVSASDLRHSRGKGTLKPELFKVEYVPITKDKIPYPDPLPPVTPFELKPDQAQPVWISVRVPKNAAPGVYRGSVKVEAGKESRELPLNVRVWDFTLPDTPSSATAFGIWDEWIARCHGVERNSIKAKELYRKYYEMLLDHKVSAYTIPVDLMSDEAPKYLNDPRMTSYTIPRIEDDTELRKVINRLIEGGWFKKSFFYWLDEPVTKDAYNNLLAICQRLKKVEPQSRIIAPFFTNPDFDKTKTVYDLMIGNMNLWCANSHFFDLEKATRPTLTARKNAGETVWWYVCCGPGAPYNNLFVEFSGMNHRTLLWNQKREGVDGLLYWATTYWNPAEGCDDPWESMMTIKSINPNIHGDGSLFYPGKKVGIDGPVSSVRLKILQDGLEDFDYLTLADQRLGSEVTNTYIAKVARSLSDYEQDPVKFEKVRRELGSMLEKATVEMRPKL